jgi:type IV secretory pathway TrbD component
MSARSWVDDTLAEATGHRHRHDPVGKVGGPAGNARLTAWLGVLLLVLFLAELATLLDVVGLLSWHIVIGVLLIPPALTKTASTGWRIVRYYTRHEAYRRAGPPPMPLRVLGPLVVLSTLSVLGTGLALVVIGPDATRAVLLTVLGYRVDALTLHQGTFIVWATVTGLHTLARLVPAVRILGRPAVPGGPPRGVVIAVTALAAAVVALLVLGISGPWLTADLHPHRHERPPAATIAP